VSGAVASGFADASRRWGPLEECRLDPRRPASDGYRRLSDEVVSRTDPDAAPMRAAGAATVDYHDHYVVDGNRSRIVLHALVTPADIMEHAPMLDLRWRVRFRALQMELRPKRAVGDTTYTAYGTIENIREHPRTSARSPIGTHALPQPLDPFTLHRRTGLGPVPLPGGAAPRPLEDEAHRGEGQRIDVPEVLACHVVDGKIAQVRFVLDGR
jgi:hypothetical protein